MTDVRDGDEPRWLDEEEQRTWRAFLRLQHDLLSAVAHQLRTEAKLSDSDYEVLVHLSEAPDGRLRPFEIGQQTRWEKSRLSHHLTRMEARGLLRRERCPTDNRGAHIVLTDAGRSAITAAAPGHVAHVRRWFIDVLTPDERATLVAIADRVTAGLAADLGPACDGPEPGAERCPDAS